MTETWTRLAGVAGVAAPLIYGAAVALGGQMTPGYSHMANAISELTDIDAPARVTLSGAFVAYDLCLLAFASALPHTVFPHRRALTLAAVTLAVVALAGVGMSTVFPAGDPGARIPLTGWTHIALAAVASLGSMVAVLALARSAAASDRFRGLARFSYAIFAVILVSGAWAAISAATHSPLMGLVERVTIGAFMVWLLAVGVALLRTPA